MPPSYVRAADCESTLIKGGLQTMLWDQGCLYPFDSRP
jgi:hypothetical protein